MRVVVVVARLLTLGSFLAPAPPRGDLRVVLGPRLVQDLVDELADTVRSDVDRPAFAVDRVVEDRLASVALAFESLASASSAATYKTSSIAARVGTGTHTHGHRIRIVVNVGDGSLVGRHAGWERKVETLSRKEIAYRFKRDSRGAK